MPDHQTPPAEWQLKPIAIAGLLDRVPVVGPLTIGRASSNDVVLPESAYPQVSGHHARILVGEHGQVVVEDLGARNGTFVNERRVERATLVAGDVLRLGIEGPQFVVEPVGAIAATAVIHPRASGRHADLSETTIVRVREALGIPADAGISELVESSERRGRHRLRWVVVGTVAMLAAGVVAARVLQQGDLQRLTELNATLQARLAGASDAFEQQQDAWEQQKQRLEQERAGLQTRIQELAANEQASLSELSALRLELDQTNTRLQRYDPVNVERARLQEVGRVQRAVVFVETRMHLRNTKTDELLRIRAGTPGTRGGSMSFSHADPLFELESSGSGFCIAADGFIVTNAHVVRPNPNDAIDLGPEERLVPDFVCAVVFSGDDRRHEAEIVKVLDGMDEDLALLHIEPFPDMPHLEGFRSDTTVPGTGAEVYLHGFPLGKSAMQEGNRVIASSFRGILSRTVSNWLQVDAAVHPGNSGGPLTDANGRVIGVVTRVQRIDGDAIAPDMGYAIPIAVLGKLWPIEGGK